MNATSPSVLPHPTTADRPTVPIPFARLVAVEWRKSTDTRSSRWVIGLVSLAMAAVVLVPLLSGGDDWTYDDFLGLPALVMTTLLPVVAILTLTTEWSRHTVLTTFTQEPRRARVVGAKVSASMLLALAGATFVWTVAFAGIGIATVCGRGVDNDLDLLKVVGNLAFMALIMLKAVALGALLANTAAAIVLFFALPTAFAILGDAIGKVGPWLDTTTTFGWIYDAHWSGHAAQIAVSTLIWVVVPLVAGLVVTQRREVK